MTEFIGKPINRDMLDSQGHLLLQFESNVQKRSDDGPLVNLNYYELIKSWNGLGWATSTK